MPKTYDLSPDVQARFWLTVQKQPEGCWVWRGNVALTGYGRFCGHKWGYVLAHRYSFLAAGGTIAEGQELHHTCENKLCVNPAHLMAVTRRQHSVELTPHNITAQNAAKTHCAHGHALTGDNVYHYHGGGRNCRACARAYQAKRRERYRAKLEAEGIPTRAQIRAATRLPKERPTDIGKLEVTVTINCGVCRQPTPLQAKGLDNARREARAAGWKSTFLTGWTCPACLDA